MSQKRNDDKKDPRYPWTARQRRQKLGARQNRKRARHEGPKPIKRDRHV